MFAGILWTAPATSAGINPKPVKPFDGVNVWRTLTTSEIVSRPGSEVGARERAWLFAPWKLVQQADGRRELYDLTKDPAEAKNLAAEKPDIVAKLAAEWEKTIEGVKLRGGGSGRQRPGGKGRRPKGAP